MRKPFVVAAAVNDLEANNEIILHWMGVNTTITYFKGHFLSSKLNAVITVLRKNDVLKTSL